MVNLYHLINSILPLSVLPFCIICPVLVIILSLRLNFHLQASFLLYGFLCGSFLTGMTGLLCFYKHVTVYFDLKTGVVPSILVSNTQEFVRTFLSTTITSIFIVKFLSKAMASRETVNNSGIGFFILMTFAKFCCVFILPNVKFYSLKSSGQTISFQIFELLECFVDVICLASSLLFALITCNKAGSTVQPLTLTSDTVHPDSLPVTQPLQLPSFLAVSVTRVLLVLSLQIRYKYERQVAMELITQDLFVVMHALVTPLLTLVTHPDMRRQVVQLIRRRPGPEPETPGMEMFSGSGRREAEEDEDSGDTDSEAGGGRRYSRSVQARRASHRPDTAPTRPSSASTAPGSLLPGGVSESECAPRRQYRSNLRSVSMSGLACSLYKSVSRKHRSALETVVAAPRKRKLVRNVKKKGGPLDGVMLNMVGEKVIPLQESDDEDPSSCKTM